MTRRPARAAGLALLATASILGLSPAQADEGSRAVPPQRCRAIDRVAAPRLRVFLDRRTGRLRIPTPEEARALYESGGRGVESLEPLEIVTHPNGMRTVDLKGAFDSDLVVRRNADGSLSTICGPATSKAPGK